MVAVRRPAGKPKLEAPEALDERKLVHSAQADPSKFAALYELHFERVYAYVARRVRDEGSAEDVTSDTFHRALAGLGKYEWRGKPFVAWLYRIAANAIADQFKRTHRERQADELEEPEASATFSSSGVDPEEAHSGKFTGGADGFGGLTAAEYETVERDARLFRLVEALPDAQRRVVRERFIEERSIKEIARRLEKSEGAVKQLQFRALQTLREQMGGRDA
jgi:RNA polymerase sigma-70 factor (ECF subfamily)